MSIFERFLGGKKPSGNPETKPMDDIVTEEAAPKLEAEKNINSTHDLRMALVEGRVDEVEDYLLKEVEHPSQNGHNDFWLKRELSLLISVYKKNNASEKIDALKEKLPDHLKYLCEMAS